MEANYKIKEDISYYHSLKRKMSFTDKFCWDRHLKNSDGTLNYQWGFSHSWFICSNMQLCKLIKPTSYQEFYENYVGKYAADVPLLPEPLSENKTDYECYTRYNHGRTEEYLMQMAHKMKEEVEKEVPVVFSVNDYYEYIIYHIIIETFNGYIKEVKAQNLLVSLYEESSIIDTDGYADTMCGVDFLLKKKDNTVLMVQVKPYSFFISNRTDTNRDRMSHMEGGYKYKCLRSWMIKHLKNYNFANNELLYIVYKDGSFIEHNQQYLYTIRDWMNILS